MARPDLKIGEETFHPVKRNLLGKIVSNVEYVAATLLTDYLFPNRRQYEEAALLWQAHIFYGQDAGKALEEAIRPSVRTTTEIKMAQQGINIIRRPTITIIDQT